MNKLFQFVTVTATSVVLAAGGYFFTSCTSSTNDSSSESATKSLILYYSQTGATQQVAELLQKKVNADIESLQLVSPYDGDFQQTIARCQQEMASGTTPELQAFTSNIAAYDTIYIGYPVWFGTYAMPIATLIKDDAFEGKVVIPFCTFGSGGLNTSAAALAENMPKTAVLPGYGVRNARVSKADAELDLFLISSGIIEGEMPQLADFSEQVAVTDADKALFNEACSGYQMPLGSPVTVGCRALADGTEYLYTVESQGQDGSTQQSKIYVIKPSAEGAVAEFTQVVR